MRILLATHVLVSYGRPRIPVDEPAWRERVFRFAAAHGFDGIEVGSWWFDPGTATRETTLRLRDEMAAHGLAFGGFNLLRKNVTHPAVRDANRADILAAIDRAGDAGARFVSASLSIEPSVLGVAEDRVRGLPRSPGSSREAIPGEVEDASSFLGEAAARAAGRGVELSLELHHCSLADTSAAVLRILDLAGSPNLFPNPDLVNTIWAWDRPEEAWWEPIERLGARARVWHVKNIQRIAIPDVPAAAFTHVPLDRGDVDYRYALGRMVELGFDGDISIEGAGPGDFLGFAARGIDYLRGLMAEIAATGGVRVQ